MCHASTARISAIASPVSQRKSVEASSAASPPFPAAVSTAVAIRSSGFVTMHAGRARAVHGNAAAIAALQRNVASAREEREDPSGEAGLRGRMGRYLQREDALALRREEAAAGEEERGEEAHQDYPGIDGMDARAASHVEGTNFTGSPCDTGTTSSQTRRPFSPVPAVNRISSSIGPPKTFGP